MYKRLLIIALSLLFSGVAFAQEQQDPWIWPDDHIKDALFLRIGVGPKIGGGMAMATEPSFFDFDLKGNLAYQIGATLNFQMANHSSVKPHGIGHWGLEIEALYGSRNYKSGDETMAMRCLEIPILLQFYITQGFLLEAGLTTVKLLNVSPGYLQTGGVVAYVGGIKGNDVMFSAGLCYKTSFGLDFGFRYNYGLSEWAENFHSKSSAAMVSVSYLFSLIK